MDAGFKIGVELELLLQPTRKRNEDFEDLGDFFPLCRSTLPGFRI